MVFTHIISCMCMHGNTEAYVHKHRLEVLNTKMNEYINCNANVGVVSQARGLWSVPTEWSNHAKHSTEVQ